MANDIILINTKETTSVEEFMSYITIFQFLSGIYDLLIGSALIFGALKWRKGLITTTAFYWGLYWAYWADPL